MSPQHTPLLTALAAANASTRLKAALAIGTEPDPALIDALVARCAIEPDFYVRDMLTWALLRHPPALTVPLLLVELGSPLAQARSQALHSLSKIKDASAWPAITRELLRDTDEEVAKAAWRAAVVLVPAGQQTELAEELALQLGRGDRKLQLSLSRALVTLGADVIEPIVRKALSSERPQVKAHAQALERLLQEPEAGSQVAVNEVKRLLAPGAGGGGQVV